MNPGSLAHPISPSCIPRMGGGEPYTDTADRSYERIEEVSEEEKKWHYDSDTYTYSYRMFDGKIARIYEEYEEAKDIPGMWNQNGNCSLIVFDENNIENKKEYKYTKEWVLKRKHRLMRC